MKLNWAKLLLAISPLNWLTASCVDRGPVPGIWTLRGVRFNVIYFRPLAQPETTVVLACPGEDPIRLRPLPVV